MSTPQSTGQIASASALASRSGATARRARPVYQSLLRTPRFAGVDRSFLVLEVTLVLAVAVGMGVSWATLVVVAVVVGVTHPLLVALTRRDDMMTSVATRALTQAPSYAPLGPVETSPRRPARAVPKR